MEDKTIKINWEDAPEGTTHYDPQCEITPYKRYVEETNKWFTWWGLDSKWLTSRNTKEWRENYIKRPTEEKPYSKPKSDPFIASLKKKQVGVTEEISLVDYLETITRVVDQDEVDTIYVEQAKKRVGGVALEFPEITISKVTTVSPPTEEESQEAYLNTLLDETLSSPRRQAKELFAKKAIWAHKLRDNIKGCVDKEGIVTFSDPKGLLQELQNENLEVESESEKASTYSGVSWYDYEKEELIGLPERGELVYDRHSQEDVEYLGKLHYEDTVILETQEGKCYDRIITHLKPVDFKESPVYKACKEQHNLLESLVGDVDSNLQGYTHKAAAIKLYHKGWRINQVEG